MFVRSSDCNLSLANMMRTHLCTALGAMKFGLNILFEQEGVKLDKMYGHGGLFKTPLVGQKLLAAAINAPVSVMATAGEGGAWGIAVLASYMINKEEGETLESYLANKVFANQEAIEVAPDPEDVAGYDKFFERYKAGLVIERAAVDSKIW